MVGFQILAHQMQISQQTNYALVRMVMEVSKLHSHFGLRPNVLQQFVLCCPASPLVFDCFFCLCCGSDGGSKEQ